MISGDVVLSWCEVNPFAWIAVRIGHHVGSIECDAGHIRPSNAGETFVAEVGVVGGLAFDRGQT
jgi:hypothetical protein